jgi:transposase
MRKSAKFSPDVVERAVRMVFDGCTAETLRRWVRRGERDGGVREGPTTAEQQRVKELDREVREVRRANEILKLASAFFAQAELDRRLIVEAHRDRLGVEPICKALQVAPSAYWREAARRRDPALCPPRRRSDAALLPEIERVWNAKLLA